MSALRRFIVAFAAAICLQLTKEVSTYEDSYNQNGYRLIHHHVVIDSMNKDYIKDAMVHNTKFNRTTRTFSGEITLIKDLHPTKVFGRSIVYKFMNNQYRKWTAMQMKVNICDALKRNLFGVQEAISGYSNLPGKCPIKKGSYYMSQYLPDASKLPPYLPEGRYRVTSEVNDEDGVQIGQMSWYGSVDKIIKKPSSSTKPMKKDKQ